MTKRELEELKKLVEVATPGPWETWPPDEINPTEIVTHRKRDNAFLQICTTNSGDTYKPFDDCRFIAAAHKAIPKLIAEVEKLRKALIELAEEHEDQADAWAGDDINGGDLENSKYHSGLAKIAREALGEEE